MLVQVQGPNLDLTTAGQSKYSGEYMLALSSPSSHRSERSSAGAGSRGKHACAKFPRSLTVRSLSPILGSGEKIRRGATGRRGGIPEGTLAIRKRVGENHVVWLYWEYVRCLKSTQARVGGFSSKNVPRAASGA